MLVESALEELEVFMVDVKPESYRAFLRRLNWICVRRAPPW
jgi:hypothetical protein